uniref:Putative secreted protein n=1 Tax=Anopheles triannulatus TaxID=58253 RepID=A0A2M4B2F0_9DIPT
MVSHCLALLCLQFLNAFLYDHTVEVYAGVEDNPRDQKARERSHEAFLDHFPHAAVRFLVDRLEICTVQIHDTAVNQGK